MSPQVLGKNVSPIGFGMMGFSWRPEPIPVEDAIKTLKASLDAGCTFWNGGEFYGTPEYNSMTILKAYFTKYPEDVSKVSIIVKGASNLVTIHPDQSPEVLRGSADNIIKQLEGIKGLKVIFGISRRDPKADFKTTLDILQKEYIDTGKLAGMSLSECNANTVHEAAKYVKIAAAEVELSLFSPDVLKNGVAAACAQYSIPIVAYSPMSRGILTGRFKEAADFSYIGRIAGFPRLQDEALQHNLKLVKQLETIAEKKGCTTPQLAINWVRALSNRSDLPDIIPIPGSTTVERVKENLKVIDLSDEEMKSLNDLVNSFETAGTRYPKGAPTEL